MRNNWSVYPTGYMYWNEKKQFLLEYDTYSVWTIFAVESGKFTYQIDGQKGDAGFGDIIVCPPGAVFHRRTITPLTFHFIKFVWELEPDPEEAAMLGGRWIVRDAERLMSTYRYMKEVGSGIREEPAIGRMKHLLEDLWRLFEIERSIAAEEAQLEVQRPDLDMQQARQWLFEHACAPMMMRELADKLGITPVQLTRRFRTAYRTTPSEFVTSLRLRRACQLLEETTHPIEFIAQQCGYENGFYLSRVFSAKLGLTPSEHRKLHRI